MLSIGSPLFPFLPKNTNIFPFSSNNTTTGEPCDMRLWREYIFEVCQSKLYQPTTAGSNPLQGDTYPVDLIAWRLSVWNGNIANYPQWKCLHSETNDYTPLIKNFPNSLLEAMSTFKNLNQKKAFQVFSYEYILSNVCNTFPPCIYSYPSNLHSWERTRSSKSCFFRMRSVMSGPK